MMVNGSNSTDTDAGWEKFPIYLIYFGQGIIIGGSNLCIVCSILRYEALRSTKEYLIVMGQSLADFIYQIGFTFGGGYRLSLLLSGQHETLFYTPWRCMLTPHNLIWSFGPHFSTLMLSVVSLDRLLLVAFPWDYLSWTDVYAKRLLAGAFGFCFSFGMIGIAATFHTRDDTPNVPARCVTESAIKPEVTGWLYTRLHTLLPPFFAFVSVVLYVALWVIYKKKTNKVNPTETSNEKKQQLKRQRRLTVTLAISCSCTFFIFCIPFTTAQWLFAMGYDDTIAMSFWMLSNLNPLCNVFIYPMRHKEVRMALKGLFTCKQMPSNLSAWEANTAANITVRHADQ